MLENVGGGGTGSVYARVCWRKGYEGKGGMVTGSLTLNFLRVMLCWYRCCPASSQPPQPSVSCQVQGGVLSTQFWRVLDKDIPTAAPIFPAHPCRTLGAVGQENGLQDLSAAGETSKPGVQGGSFSYCALRGLEEAVSGERAG